MSRCANSERAHGRHDALDTVTFIELLGVGTRVNPHGPIGLAQFAKGREAEIESPVAGKIVEVNEAVSCREQPALLNDDPEGQGWLVVIEER